MKKGWLFFLVLCVLLIAAVYIFIPARLTVSSVVLTNANSVAAYRCLTDENKWIAWWPGTFSATATNDSGRSFQYNQVTYKIEQSSVNALGVRITHPKIQTGSILQPIRYGGDSTAIQWSCDLTTGSDPFTKIVSYRAAAQLKKNMDTVLKRVQVFLSKKENVYGIAINRATLKDSTLVATRYFGTSYPDTETVYRLIANVRRYIVQQGAQEINYPMLHIADRGKGRFETMVAIPVNKALKGTTDIFFKRMQVSTMLATDVYGGPERLKKANAELQYYLDDHHLFSPAISFESLVTDRLAEPDTAKWVTKIYVPVMEYQLR